MGWHHLDQQNFEFTEVCGVYIVLICLIGVGTGQASATWSEGKVFCRAGFWQLQYVL